MNSLRFSTSPRTDWDNDMEEQLRKKKFFQDRKIQFNVGNHTVCFNTIDNIFQMTEPIDQTDEFTISYFKDENCVLCKKEIPNSKTNKACQFCGCLACERCMYKSRKFKEAPVFTHDGVGDISFQNGTSTTAKSGLICKLCDRKFAMWIQFRKYQEAMREQEQILQEQQAVAS